MTTGTVGGTRPVTPGHGGVAGESVPAGDESGPDAPDQPAGAEGTITPGGALPGRSSGFEVHLDVFEGPFDLLLGLISKHKLDVTEIALAKVTDEFVAWVRAQGKDWDLSETSEFLVVAATLLDLKAARLLPSAEIDDEEDLALLEARDLLFARLLQYRAFKDVAATFAQRIAVESRRVPRSVPVEPRFAQLLPELVLGITPEQLAMIAARALTPKPPPVVGLEHLHAPPVSVREQAAVIVDRLRRTRSASFRVLVADAGSTLVVVARFLALLELFREAAVAFDQVSPLGELTVRWTGSDDGEIGLVDEFDASATTLATEAAPSAEVPSAAGEPGEAAAGAGERADDASQSLADGADAGSGVAEPSGVEPPVIEPAAAGADEGADPAGTGSDPVAPGVVDVADVRVVDLREAVAPSGPGAGEDGVRERTD